MNTTLEVSKCPGCGKAIEREIPTGLPGWMREFATGMAIWHDACLDSQDTGRLEAERREDCRRNTAMSGVPKDLLTRGETAVLPDGLSDLMAAWASGEEKHVVLTGEFGVGKTTAAAVAAVRRLELGRNLWWRTAPYLLSQLGSGLGTQGREQALGVLSGGRALVLDDLDKVRPTDYGAEQVFIAIDRRLTEGVPLLITSNLTPAEMADRWPEPYGPAIASRLGGECRVVQMQGDDRRFQ
jgi:DNA replication protein DnaC